MNKEINIWFMKNYKSLKIYCFERYNKDDFEDIFHETCLTLLDKDETYIKLLINSNEIYEYFKRIFWVNCHSKYGPYQWKYNKLKNRHIIESIINDNIESLCEYEPEDIKYIDVDIETVLLELDVEWIYKLTFKEYLTKKIVDRSYSFHKMGIEGEFSENILQNRFYEVKNKLKKIIK